MATLLQHPEPLLPSPPLEGDSGVNRHPLLLDSSGLYLQCPLSEAPGCFRNLLVRSLELAESNFVPTNWRGFSDHFGLRELRARSAEELVDMWANKHPYKHEHTLQKVVAYAESKNHRKLLDSFLQALQDHLLPEDDWTESPTSCFQHCHSCVPLSRTSSRSSDDITAGDYDIRNSANPPNRRHGHRRTHSLPKNIEIGHSHHPQSPSGGDAGRSSVTNIYMTCSCKNSPFTPSSALSPLFPSSSSSAAASATPWPHPLISPASTGTTSTISYTDTYSPSPINTTLQSPVHSLATSPVHTVTASTPYHGSNTSTPVMSRTLHRPATEYASLQASTTDGYCENVERVHHQTPSEVMVAGARRRHSSLSHDPAAAHQVKRVLLLARQAQSGLNTHASSSSSSSSNNTDDALTTTSQTPSEISPHSPFPPGSHTGAERITNHSNLLQQQTNREISHSEEEEVLKSKPTDALQEFGRRLFDTAPYNLVQKFYNGTSREIIILVLATFFLYNGLRCVLQTMCEDGGFTKISVRSESTGEVVRRLTLLSLRVLTVVVTPLCCCLHIGSIASKPWIPRTTFTPEAAVERMMRVHRNFSPHYEVKFIQAEPRRVYQTSETMTKRHINSIWMSIVYVVLFAALLSYIGGVKLVARKFTEAGVCQIVTASLVHVPLLEDDIHILMVLDLFLMFAVLISVNMLKDYYYYENRIAVFAVTVGGEAEQLYREIRRRWVVLDWYSYLAAIAISCGTCVLASVDQTLVPDPPMKLHPEHLLNWCFWISVLSVLPCLGLSSNRLVKKTSLPAFLLIAFLLRVVNVNIDAIPPESLEVFYLLGGAVMVLCLLQSLSVCHYHHYQNKRKTSSLVHFLVCLALMLILSLSVIGAIYRETVHLARFVQW